MSRYDYAELAASVLKGKPISIRRYPSLSRDKGIAVVAQAMRQVSRSRQRAQLWYVALGAAAAAAAVAVSIHHFKRPMLASVTTATSCAQSSALCARTSGAVPTVDVGHLNGREVLPGAVLQADSGTKAQVHFDSGTRLSLEGNTIVAYDEGAATHRFTLSRGAMHLAVEKLTRGQRFFVNTLDAEVEVRGTVFNVKVIDPTEGCGQRTQVSVEEGVVEVRTARDLHTLHAGDTWAGDCADTHAKPTQREPVVGGVATTGASQRSAPRTKVKDGEQTLGEVAAGSPAVADVHQASYLPRADVQPKSVLAQQNDLYARASAERHLRHWDAALVLYQQLIIRYPGSALVESAQVQRLRILRDSKSPLGRAEAERYLQSFPQGFARGEAAAILDTP